MSWMGRVKNPNFIHPPCSFQPQLFIQDSRVPKIDTDEISYKNILRIYSGTKLYMLLKILRLSKMYRLSLYILVKWVLKGRSVCVVSREALTALRRHNDI